MEMRRCTSDGAFDSVSERLFDLLRHSSPHIDLALCLVVSLSRSALALVRLLLGSPARPREVGGKVLGRPRDVEVGVHHVLCFEVTCTLNQLSWLADLDARSVWQGGDQDWARRARAAGAIAC